MSETDHTRYMGHGRCIIFSSHGFLVTNRKGGVIANHCGGEYKGITRFDLKEARKHNKDHAMNQFDILDIGCLEDGKMVPPDHTHRNHMTNNAGSITL